MQDEQLANYLRALGHPVRLNILRILASRNKDCCCADVTQCLPLAQSTVSQHIKVLLQAGLIERRAEGTRNCYVLASDQLSELQLAFAGLSTVLKNLEAEGEVPVQINKSEISTAEAN